MSMIAGKNDAGRQHDTNWVASAIGGLIGLLIVAGGAYGIFRYGAADRNAQRDDPVIRAVEAQQSDLQCLVEILSGKSRSPSCRSAKLQMQEEKAR